jgi:hypothetical protein
MLVASPAPLSAIQPRFDLGRPSEGPFPSDQLTVPDPAQRTGVRIHLPLPECVVAPSTCDEVRLLNELDGFDLEPRLVIPFDGPIDLASITARSLFLVRLAAGPPETVGVERLVWDPGSSTLYARPEALLEPETRYGLVVTRAVRDRGGRPLAPASAFGRLLAGGGPAASRPYSQALRGLLVALRRRGLRADDVVVASVFTTGSVTGFLERAREALDQRPPPPALLAYTTRGDAAYFRRSALAALRLWRQVRASPNDVEESPVLLPPEPPLPPGGEPVPPDGVRVSPLPLAALPADTVGAIAVGWYRAPAYLTGERRAVEGPTGQAPGPAPASVSLPLVVVLPAGVPPPDGWPLALFGHGYGGEMLSGALLIGGTLARHGIATAAVSVVGHGGGPDSRLVAVGVDARTRVVRVPGRGVDVDGDGVIGDAEGLGPSRTGPLAVLGLRDGLRQQVVDLLTLVRALRDGLDVDGDGRRDVRVPTFYVGHSLGGVYGALFLAVEPKVRVGVLNALGGPVSEIARLSPVFRPLLREALAARTPALLNAEPDFREDLPARGDGPVADPAAGALAVQAFLARAEWLGRRGDPVAVARHLREAPLPGLAPARVLVQFAAGDGVVPNATTRAFVRAGGLGDAVTVLRMDRVAAATGSANPEPHAFLLRVGAPGLVGRVARAAQRQAALFLLAGGTVIPSAAGEEGVPTGVFEDGAQ